MSEDYEWGAPPPSQDMRNSRVRFVEALKKRPNEWAKYPREYDDKAKAQTAASGFRRQWDFLEVVAREGFVYARYLSDDGE